MAKKNQLSQRMALGLIFVCVANLCGDFVWEFHVLLCIALRLFSVLFALFRLAKLR